MTAVCAQFQTQVFTIESGETTSDNWGIAEFNKGSIQIPTMTGGTLTLEGTNDGTVWVSVGTITVATAALQALPSTVFNVKRMRIKSSSSEGAERTLTVLLKGSS